MPCSAQNVETAPRGASSGHCEIARRTRGSMGSLTATTRALRPKCHHQDHPNCHRCPDTELSPMSWEMTYDKSIRQVRVSSPKTSVTSPCEWSSPPSRRPQLSELGPT